MPYVGGVILSLISAFALYVASTLHRPILILATDFATALGLLMLIVKIFLHITIQKEIGRR